MMLPTRRTKEELQIALAKLLVEYNTAIADWLTIRHTPKDVRKG